MTQPDNTENLGNKAEEKLEVGLIEKPECAKNSPDHQTENVKEGSDENTRKRNRNIEEDESDEKTRKRIKVDFAEDENEVRDSNRGIVRRSFIPKGIENAYMQCFINAGLQCLLVMDNIRERYMKPSVQPSDSNFITNQICTLLAQRYLMGSPDGEVPDPSEAPTELQNKLNLEKNHSILTIIEIVRSLDVEENEGLKTQEDSEIRPLMEDFKISFQTKVTCSSCRSPDWPLPEKTEGMLVDVNLPDDEVCKLPQLSGMCLNKLETKWLRLETLLPFIGLKNISDASSKYCKECKFEISIEKAPRVLVVSWTAQLDQNRRASFHLSKRIEFETYLDLSRFASMDPATMRPREDYKYRLIAVADFQNPPPVEENINPTEPVCYHTSAFVLGSKYGKDKWIQFDDERVELDIDESQVLNDVTHWVSVYERANFVIDPNKPLNNEESRRFRDGESSSSMTKSKEESG